ncbi:MAG: hypothetical protein WA126_14485, partial [Thermodesulfovibrionales bacterium]
HSIFRKSRHGKIRISSCIRGARSLQTTNALAGRYSWINDLSGRRLVLSIRLVPFTSIRFNYRAEQCIDKYLVILLFS